MIFSVLVAGVRPVLLLVAIVFTVLVLVGDLSDSPIIKNFYFLRIETSGLTSALRPKPLNDWYTIGLWNYCRGHGQSSDPVHCAPRVTAFQFNPVEVFGYNTTAGKALLAPSAARNGIPTSNYQDAYKWLFPAFIGSIAATGAVAVLSAVTLCFSCWFNAAHLAISSAISAFAVVCAVGGAAAAYSVFSKLEEYVEHDMLRRGIGLGHFHASLGTLQFAFAWVAAGASSLSFICTVILFISACTSSRRQKNGKASYHGTGMIAPEDYGEAQDPASSYPMVSSSSYSAGASYPRAPSWRIPRREVGSHPERQPEYSVPLEPTSDPGMTEPDDRAAQTQVQEPYSDLGLLATRQPFIPDRSNPNHRGVFRERPAEVPEPGEYPELEEY